MLGLHRQTRRFDRHPSKRLVVAALSLPSGRCYYFDGEFEADMAFQRVDLLTAITVAICIAGGFYFVIEFREILNADRDRPSKPVSGIESALGSSAVVSKEFATTSAGRLVGRVRFDGEDWRAEYIGSPSIAPKVGQVVNISEIDAAKLIVKVEGPDSRPDP